MWSGLCGGNYYIYGHTGGIGQIGTCSFGNWQKNRTEWKNEGFRMGYGKRNMVWSWSIKCDDFWRGYGKGMGKDEDFWLWRQNFSGVCIFVSSGYTDCCAWRENYKRDCKTDWLLQTNGTIGTGNGRWKRRISAGV